MGQQLNESGNSKPVTVKKADTKPAAYVASFPHLPVFSGDGEKGDTNYLQWQLLV